MVTQCVNMLRSSNSVQVVQFQFQSPSMKAKTRTPRHDYFNPFTRLVRNCSFLLLQRREVQLVQPTSLHLCGLIACVSITSCALIFFFMFHYHYYYYYVTEVHQTGQQPVFSGSICICSMQFQGSLLSIISSYYVHSLFFLLFISKNSYLFSVGIFIKHHIPSEVVFVTQ